MSQDLITSTEAARRLGVAVSTIKRWADDGTLPCVRTAGGHRRFRPADLAVSPEEGVEAWTTLLLGDRPILAVQGELLKLRADRGSWPQACSHLAQVMRTLGQRWAAGELEIHQERRASNRLAQALAQVASTMALAPDAPVCLLVVPEGELHTLGLSLLEPCLHELGWSTLWLGRDLPNEEIARAVRERSPDAVAASGASGLSELHARAFVEALPEDPPLLLGGSAPWPRPALRLSALAQALPSSL